MADAMRTEDNILKGVAAVFLCVLSYGFGTITEYDYFPEDIERARQVCEDYDGGLLVFVASQGEVLGAECTNGMRYSFDTIAWARMSR